MALSEAAQDHSRARSSFQASGCRKDLNASTDCRRWDWSEAPGSAFMASSADVEVVATEGALAVVTGHATLPTSGRMMIERFGSCYLPPLRHSSPYLMAFV